MIEGLSHITLIVGNLEKSAQLFKILFAAEEIYDSRKKNFSLAREKFFLIGDLWLVLMEGEPKQEKTYHHIAFKITESDFSNYKNRIESLGLEIWPTRSRVEGEGRSLYFYDYDQHLFELHTGTLTERLSRYQSEG